MAFFPPTFTPVASAVNRVAALQVVQVAEELNTRLGLKLTAAVGRACKTSKASEWTKGVSLPRRLRALRAALAATYVISTRYGDAAARAWFMSSNPTLGMRSPLTFIREARHVKDFELLVICAVQDAS